MVVVIAAAQLLAIGVFDVAAGRLAINDDWVYSWSVRQLAERHGLVLFPEQSVPALPQLLLGALAWVAHPGPTALRLETLIFGVSAAVLVAVLSRQLGAAVSWSVVAAAALLSFPVFASVTTSFMTEPLYLDLLLLGAILGFRLLSSGQGGWVLVPVVLLGVLDRQHAVGIPAALTVVVLVGDRQRMNRRRLTVLAACWVAAGTGLMAPGLLHIATPKMAFRASSVLHPSASLALALATYTPGLIGLLALPFGLALGRVALTGERDPRAVIVAAAAIGLCVIAFVSTFVFPGNYLTAAGLGPITVPGTKPPLFALVLAPLKLAALAAFVALAVAVHRRRDGPGRSSAAAFVVLLAATQAVPILTFAISDRYFLPVLVLLLPFLARTASSVRLRNVDTVWAAVVLAAMVAVYAVGEQDYLSWQQARDQFARQVIAAAPSATFWPGYEPYAVFEVLPGFEAGRYRGLTGANLPSSDGPLNPRLVLLITDRSDARPGVNYSSLVPGRIVLECLQGPCPILPAGR